MIVRSLIAGVCLVACLAGCGQPLNGLLHSASVDGVRLLGLTTLEADAAEGAMAVRAFVRPAQGYVAERVRFELYAFAPYDVNPRGKRIMLWPEIEPGGADLSNRNWRPHLEAFEFVLSGVGPLAANKTYLVEVTAWATDGTRKSDTIKVTVKR